MGFVMLCSSALAWIVSIWLQLGAWPPLICGALFIIMRMMIRHETLTTGQARLMSLEEEYIQRYGTDYVRSALSTVGGILSAGAQVASRSRLENAESLEEFAGAGLALGASKLLGLASQHARHIGKKPRQLELEQRIDALREQLSAEEGGSVLTILALFILNALCGFVLFIL